MVHSEERNECRQSLEIKAHFLDADLLILGIAADKPWWMAAVSTSYSPRERGSLEGDPGPRWTELFSLITPLFPWTIRGICANGYLVG